MSYIFLILMHSMFIFKIDQLICKYAYYHMHYNYYQYIYICICNWRVLVVYSSVCTGMCMAIYFKILFKSFILITINRFFICFIQI